MVKASTPITRIAQGLALTESALRLTGDISKTRYIILHNKKDYYVYKVGSAPRLVSKKDVGNAVVKLTDKDLYILFDVNPQPLDIAIDAQKLAVNKGDNRISYYTTLIDFSKIIGQKNRNNEK